MCVDPITASAIIGIATSAAKGVQSVQTAKSAAKFAEFRQAETTKLATANFANTVNQLELRRSQEEDAASDALQTVTRRALRAQGLAVASAASEGGTGGASVQALIGDFAQQQLEQQGIIDQNLANTHLQLNQEIVGATARANSDILSGISSPVPLPDYLSAALKITDYSFQLADSPLFNKDA